MFGGQGDNSALFNDLHMYDIGMNSKKKRKEKKRKRRKKEKEEEEEEKKIEINGAINS